MNYTCKSIYNRADNTFDVTIKFNGKEYKKSFSSIADAGNFCTDFYLTSVAPTETDSSDDCPKLK
jgi:hypothetical protein